MQHLLAGADRGAHAVLGDLARYAAEHLGGPGGVLVVDETGFLKKGSESDAVYGSDYGFRTAIEGRGLGYVLGVRTDQTVSLGLRQYRVRALLAGVPASAWRRLGCGLDEYEVRFRAGWRRHVTPSPFAPAVLAVIRSRAARPGRPERGLPA